LDSLFLSIWVIVLWVVNSKIIKPLNITGFERIVILIFQFLFVCSTLAPVAMTIYKDIRIMMLKYQQKIHKEIVLGKFDEQSD